MTAAPLPRGGVAQGEQAHRERRYHGLSHRPEYKIWKGMIQRCHTPQNPNFVRYGGRGITVCDEWRRSFPRFLRDMGSRPGGYHLSGRPRYTLERIDNGKGYSPSNCVWATYAEQAANRRPQSSFWAAASRASGISGNGLRYRLLKGMSLEEAMTKPLGIGRPRKNKTP